MAVGTCRLDLDAHALHDAAGAEIPITTMDFQMLEAFATNPDRILSRDQLSQLVRGRGWDPSDRSIDIRIGRLRRKIERDPTKPRHLRTVHALGYVFSPGGG